jgi:hypothetical protein
MRTKETSKQQRPYKKFVTIFSGIFRQRAILFTFVTLMGCAGVAIAVSAYNRNTNTTEIPVAREALVAKPASISTPLQSKISGPIEVARFAIYDVGIYPPAATVKAGNIGIIIEDYSGGTAGLVVENVTGNAPVRAAVVLREGKFTRGRQDMQLAAGSYEVYATERPDQRAKLIVE